MQHPHQEVEEELPSDPLTFPGAMRLPGPAGLQTPWPSQMPGRAGLPMKGPLQALLPGPLLLPLPSEVEEAHILCHPGQDHAGQELGEAPQEQEEEASQTKGPCCSASRGSSAPTLPTTDEHAPQEQEEQAQVLLAENGGLQELS